MDEVKAIEKQYAVARERYGKIGVDTDAALEQLRGIPISLHCWQGDDVGGFERPDSGLSGGGIMVTGGYPGKARTVDELRADLEKVYSMIPGDHRLNLHAMYGEYGGKRVDRDQCMPEHFTGWAEWADATGLKLDFNCTLFSHPKADAGLTLSSKDEGIRGFWVEHVKRCREISAFLGKKLGSPCVHDIWAPDGSKDIPADRITPRALLKRSLDEIFETEYSAEVIKDALESKLFGIGSEAYVVGSHEFYMGYALSNGKMLCLDMGHFHPTESVADKISSILQFSDELLLHVSRGVRWDSDHVAILDDSLRALAEEIIRNGHDRIHIGTDFFDASMNRIGAWVIGARAVLQALLLALLQPQEKLNGYEDSGDYFGRLALMEELKTMPSGSVWDRHCLGMDVPPGAAWIEEIRGYERDVTGNRG